MISAKALANNAAQLSETSLEVPPTVLGRNTVDAMLSGVIRGSACAIDGMLKQCQAELNADNVTVIATGGYSTLIAKYMTRKFDVVNPNLTLEGLRLLYELNS